MDVWEMCYGRVGDVLWMCGRCIMDVCEMHYGRVGDVL